MSTLTVTAKGQVTLRKDILKHLGIKPGSKVVVEKLPKGRVEIKAVPKGDISELFGILKPKNNKKLTIDEINDIIADAWAGKK